MENTYSISTFIKSNSSKTNKALIYLRITVDGSRAEISIKRSMAPERWDSKAGKVKGTKEDAREINSLIDSISLKINKIYSKLLMQETPITADIIKIIFLGKDVIKKTLMEVFDYHNRMMEERIGIDFTKSTFIRYQTTRDHIRNFIKHKYGVLDLALSRLNYSFIVELENYFKVHRRCNHNSTLKYIRNFKKIIRIAYQNDWLSKDPFKSYSIKLKEVKRIFLTKDELDQLEIKNLSIGRLDKVRDVFVFCCYTGLSYVDVEKLTQKAISKGIDRNLWIFIDRTKTGNPSHIPILPKAMAILNKYRFDPEVVTSGRLLPVISNQRINAYLKELAVLCNIDKKLTFHAARHTFATTITLTNGIPIETISSMLGHKNLKTTQHYAKIIDKKISDDMLNLREKLVRQDAGIPPG